jgi:hypothetical protein
MSQTASNQTVAKKSPLQAGALTVLVCGAIVITLGMGVRQSFGIFLKPVTADLEVGRQVFGLAIALQTLLTGLLGPAAGMLSDRFGPNRVIAAGTLIYGLGLVLTGFAQGPNSLVITLGGVVGLGMSLLTLPVVLGAVGDTGEVLMRLHVTNRCDEVALRVRAQEAVKASVPHGALSSRDADGATERVHKVGVVSVHSGGLVKDLHDAAECGPLGGA